MAQEYDTTGKDILNEQIGELMQESAVFQHQREKFIEQGAKEATFKSLMAVLNAKFHVEAAACPHSGTSKYRRICSALNSSFSLLVNAKSVDTFTEALFE